ncbi:hypothetical protein L6164_020212 [Bauhinia variegata]|uniref:Uncharacterized protein n=1 Tax=Bauhinia variegata TaxID=167791 RepID=A0ACB9MUE5_BAUVA|nr:hypothetical protein L6164_020212 [Bauhinia variegata]
MEKLSKLKGKFFKFLLHQPVASVTFHQNPSVSPSRSVAGTPTRTCRSPIRKVPIFPKEARRKFKKGGFGVREPSSPKVSCMGQVQCKNRKHKRVQAETEQRDSASVSGHEKIKKEKLQLLWIFKGSGQGQKQCEKAFASQEKGIISATVSATETTPSFGNMKKFASCRGSLSDFDAKLAPQ